MACNCKNCKDVTLFKGSDGVGIQHIEFSECCDCGLGFTIFLTDGTVYQSPELDCTTCPLYANIVLNEEFRITTLTAQVSGGQAPYTYEWSLEQNAFQGLVFISATNTSTVQMDLNPGSPTPLYQTNIGGEVASSLVKVKVTDANGQIACAYYNAVQLVFS